MRALRQPAAAFCLLLVGAASAAASAESNLFEQEGEATSSRRGFSSQERTPDNFFEQMGYDDKEIVITRKQIERFTETVFAYKPLFHEIRVRSMLGQEDPQALKREFRSRTQRLLSRYGLSKEDYAVYDRVAQQMPEFRHYMLEYSRANNFDYEALTPPETIEGVIELTQDTTTYDVEKLLNPDDGNKNSLQEAFASGDAGGGTISAMPGGL